MSVAFGQNFVATASAYVPYRFARVILSKALAECKRIERDTKRVPYLSSIAWQMVQDVEAGAIIMSAGDADLRQLAQRCADTVRHERADIGDAVAQRRCIDTLRKYRLSLPDNVFTPSVWARVTCNQWWLRKLRRRSGKLLETGALRLNLVNRHRDCYASNETVERRRQQVRRNTATLSALEIESEDGETANLLEIAQRSTANKAIRRGELMTRIRGFEEWAVKQGHDALFVTLTCPSRFHAALSASGEKNGAYDGSTPDIANGYLMNVWAKLRAALHRRAISVYGFRVAEPHHDGTPHAHFLLWFPERDDSPESRKSLEEHSYRAQQTVLRRRYKEGARDSIYTTLVNLFKKYALKDSPNEKGAAAHRVTFEKIDRTRGSAVAYIAKYIAKNIDGYNVGNDLYGNPAIEASERIEAWATTWGIRQFQQIGGAPVGVWRECRRVPELAARRAGGAVHGAVVACNRVGDSLASWCGYLEAMGGATLARHQYRVQIHRRVETVRGRYETLDKKKPAGVLDVATGDVVLSNRKAWAIRGRKAPLGLVSITVRSNCAKNRFVSDAANSIFKEFAKWVQPPPQNRS
jgi:hypothetical protein